jgi:hypothetical protein
VRRHLRNACRPAFFAAVPGLVGITAAPAGCGAQGMGSPVTAGVDSTISPDARQQDSPSPEGYSQQVFSRELMSRASHVYSCPRDRVILTQIAAPSPPPEIARDPDRLALWRNNHGGGIEYYVMSACGTQVPYACKLGWRNSCLAGAADAHL